MQIESVTLGEIVIDSRKSVIDNVELTLFKDICPIGRVCTKGRRIDSDVSVSASFFCKMFELEVVEESMVLYDVTTLTSIVWERLSNSRIVIRFDSCGSLMSKIILRLSEKLNARITYTYEDDSLDIGGVFICNNGQVTKDVSYSYLAHRYKQDGIDGIDSDIEVYINEGDTFEEFMSEHRLWEFVSKSDQKLIEAIFNEDKL